MGGQVLLGPGEAAPPAGRRERGSGSGRVGYWAGGPGEHTEKAVQNTSRETLNAWPLIACPTYREPAHRW